MSKPLISVIVPVYNIENYIEKAVATITAQTYKNLEIILVDDGSTDKTPQICDTLVECDNRIKVIHTQNQGVSSARNTGIKHATGEYITFCDGDDIIEKDMYEFLYNSLITSNADISMCGFKRINIDNSVKCTSTGKATVFNSPNEYIKALFNGAVPMSANAKLFKAEICKSTYFPTDLKTYEDKFYCFITALKSKRSIIIDTPKYTYFRRKGSSSANVFSEKFFDGIKSADRILQIVEEEQPQLLINAYINKLITVIRTYTLMVNRNGLDKYPEKAKEIVNYIKAFDNKTARKHLSKKNYIRYTVAKHSKLLFIFMSKNFDKN